MTSASPERSDKPDKSDRFDTVEDTSSFSSAVSMGQPVSLLMESTLNGGDIKLEAAGDMEADLDSSLSSLNPLSVPSASIYQQQQ